MPGTIPPRDIMPGPGWVTPEALSTASSGEMDDIPPAPTGVNVTLSAREVNVPSMYRALVRWNPTLTWDSNVCKAPVKEWPIYLRAVNSSGQPVDANGNVNVNPVTKTAIVKHPTDDEIAADPTLKRGEYIFDVAEHPGAWCWQARIQAVDMLDRKGTLSGWSASGCAPAPESQPYNLIVPPTPTGLVLMFDHSDRARHHRYHAKARCNEVGAWTPTGGTREVGIASYQFILERTTSGGATWYDDQGDPSHYKCTVTEKEDDNNTVRARWDKPVRKGFYYRSRVRCIDRHGRNSAWSSWTFHSTPSDTSNPPPPINVRGDTKVQKVGILWDSPLDGIGQDEPHHDIAYYQAQMANGPSFSGNILRFDRFVNNEQKYFHTKDYSSFFHLRVRSVDSAGNKSGWQTINHLKAEKPDTASASPEDIDWYNQQNVPLAGGQNSSAYVNSIGGGPNIAYIDTVRFFDGELFGEAKVQTTTEVGLVVRQLDDNNYLIVYLKTNGIYLAKYDVGVKTVLTSKTLTLRANQIYKIIVTMEGASLTVNVDGSEAFTYSTLADKYLKGTRMGMYVSSTTTRTEAIHHFKFTPTGMDTAEVYDEYRRPNHDSQLGVTDSEHTWVQQSGVWGIRHDPTPHGLFGASLVIPSFFNDDESIHGFALPTSAAVPQTFNGTIFEIDRPTKLMVWGLATLYNPSSYVFVGRFYLPITPENEPRTWGKKLDVTIQPGEEKTLTNLRHKFINTNVPKLVTCGWGYQSAAGESPFVEVVYDVIEVRYQKMITTIGYAPDFPLENDPNWTNSILTKEAYRTEEGDDFEG